MWTVDRGVISVLLIVIGVGLFSGLLGIKYGSIRGMTYDQKTNNLLVYFILLILVFIGIIFNTFLR